MLVYSMFAPEIFEWDLYENLDKTDVTTFIQSRREGFHFGTDVSTFLEKDKTKAYVDALPVSSRVYGHLVRVAEGRLSEKSREADGRKVYYGLLMKSEMELKIVEVTGVVVVKEASGLSATLVSPEVIGELRRQAGAIPKIKIGFLCFFSKYTRFILSLDTIMFF
jgi:hypothetical protein